MACCSGWRSIVLAAAVMSANAALAETAEDFYRGKPLTLIVSSGTGGGYDTLSRVVAKHLPKHIPGNPAVVVRNMPGAGGITAINYLFNVAPKDGLTFGQLQNTLPFEPVLGNKEALYDSSQFNWLGSQSFETGLLIVWNTVPVNSVADLQKREVSVGSPAKNSTPSFNSRLLMEALDLKLRLIYGYPSQNDVFLAMERGEVEAFPTFYSSVISTRPRWLTDHQVKLIVQYGPEPEAAIRDVPYALDLVKDPDKRRLVKAAAAPLGLGRPFAAPPGVPTDRVAYLRGALAETFADPEYLADIAQLGLPINRVQSGEALQRVIDDVWHMPDADKARLRGLAGF